jgi:hypothetical protein
LIIFFVGGNKFINLELQINKKCYFKNVIQKTRKVPFPKNVIHKITQLPKREFVLPFKKYFEKIIINKINE